MKQVCIELSANDAKTLRELLDGVANEIFDTEHSEVESSFNKALREMDPTKFQDYYFQSTVLLRVLNQLKEGKDESETCK
jgi:hypothetical protein